MHRLSRHVATGRKTLAFLAGPGRTWLLLAGAAALPLLLFGGWVGYLAAVQTRAGTSRNAALAVDGAARRIAADIVAQLDLVRTLAASTALDAPDLAVPDGINTLLRQAGVPSDWVGVVLDGSGRIVARIRAMEQDQGRLASPTLRAAIAAAPDGMLRGRTREGVPVETVYRSLPGADGWVIAFGIPLATLEVILGYTVHREVT